MVIVSLIDISLSFGTASTSIAAIKSPEEAPGGETCWDYIPLYCRIYEYTSDHATNVYIF